MEGCLRRTGSQKNALDLCKGRMLGEDDAFEVVSNPGQYPGADKRGLFESGQVLSRGKNTGGACSLPSFRNRFLGRDRLLKGADIGAAQLIQFNLTCLLGQTFLTAQLVPVAKGLRGGYADRGRGNDRPNGFDVREGLDQLAAVGAEGRAADQKQRHVRPHLGGNFQSPGIPIPAFPDGVPAFLRLHAPGPSFGTFEGSDPQLVFQPHQRGYGVGRTGTQPTLNGEPLFDMDLDRGALVKGLKSQFDHLPGGVAAVGGDAAVVCGEADRCGFSRMRRDRYDVIELQCLVNGREPMEPVWASRTDIQSEIDLCVRSDRCGHT